MICVTQNAVTHDITTHRRQGTLGSQRVTGSLVRLRYACGCVGVTACVRSCDRDRHSDGV